MKTVLNTKTLLKEVKMESADTVITCGKEMKTQTPGGLRTKGVERS